MDYSVTNVHVDTARGRFAVRAVGNPGGRIVIAVHGFADHPATFDALGTYLAARGYVTVAPYLRGHEPSPTGTPATVVEHARDMRALAEELSLEGSVMAVGHGEGAWIVHQALTEQSRSGVKHRAGECLIGSAVMLGMPGPGVVKYLMQRHPSVAWSMRHLALTRTGSWGVRRFARDNFSSLGDLWRRWSPGFEAPEGHLQLVRSMYAGSMPEALGILEMPSLETVNGWPDARILCIMGERDGAVPPHMLPGRHIAPDTGDRLILPAVGHFPHHEAPETTFEAIANWFADKPSRNHAVYV